MLASSSLWISDAVPLAAVHTLTLPLFFRQQEGDGGRERERGREDVYHAVELPASQLVCLSPSLRPETERGRDIGGGSTASFFPSLLSSLPPSFSADFPFLHSCFYISCLRLPSKGQRALRSVCKCLCGVKQPDCIWLVHSLSM